jgi:hypothetical protein
MTLPVALYFDGVSVLRTGEHPLHTVRDCLRPLTAKAAAVNGRGPGVWAEGTLTHTFFYYLRWLGPWQQRDAASDPTVYMHLYASPRQRPVLLSTSRYAEFTSAIRSGDPTLAERAARKAGVDPAALSAEARLATIGVLKIADDAYLLLPGPYASCAPEQVIGAWR